MHGLFMTLSLQWRFQELKSGGGPKEEYRITLDYGDGLNGAEFSKLKSFC